MYAWTLLETCRVGSGRNVQRKGPMAMHVKACDSTTSLYSLNSGY